MIDRTNQRIGELEADNRRDAARRYSFYRMLRSTDRVLWHLEELNRDGRREIPDDVRRELVEMVGDLPAACRQTFRERADVQGALDNLFEIQESLFRWRHPGWAGDEDDDVERAS